MTEREILELCDRKKARGFKAPPYWTAEIYGFGNWIRKYSRYPSFLPLCIYTDHGPPTLEKPLRQELLSDAPYMFYHSPVQAKNWKKATKKKSSILYSPFVYCRKQKKINPSPDAKGTLAFPAHTTITIEDESNVESYIKQLIKLPKEFQPVSVCLYYDDIKKGKYKIFQKYKIPIYTAGYYFDNRFTERFYDLLRNFKYATSNVVGSYLYYATEMGIPFSIYGQKQKFINVGDPNLSEGEFDPYRESGLSKKIYRMFGGLQRKVTPQQKKFVEYHLGLKHGISGKRMRKILYIAFFQWLFSFRVFKWLLKIVEVAIRRPYYD